jgi:hypothetical protein
VADGLAKGAGLAGAHGSPAQDSSLVATLTANTCLIVNGLKGRCDQAGQRRLVQQWAKI